MQSKEFLEVLKAQWRVIAACVVLALAAAALMTYMTTPVYTANARVYLTVTHTGGERSQDFGIQDPDLQTYVSIINTPAVLDPLRKELGMPEGHPIDVEASTTSTTSILNITARSSDPQEAADVANEIGPQLSTIAPEFSTELGTGQKIESIPLQPASAPSDPTSPAPVRNLALALLAGLVVGVGLALIRHAFDTRVRSEATIRAMSDAPMLADLPVVRGSSKEGLLSIEHDPHGRHAEAIRRLRTNLLFVDVTTGKHTFVVTSAVPGEGKTTTAINLALAMADAGAKTLLVDGDLRNPAVASTMGIEGSVGLTNLLLGETTAHEVVQSWGRSGLHVLPAGPVPPNPSELLGSPPMEELFHQLRQDYDFVLVDGPPVVPVIDAVIIQRLTGGLVMVVADDRTKKRDLSSALKELETVDATVSGFARNFVPAKQGGTYRYGYGRYEAEGTDTGGVVPETRRVHRGRHQKNETAGVNRR